MGDMARMSRSVRFITEFEDDYLRKTGLVAGDKLTVRSVGLGQDEGDGYSPAVFADLVNERTGKVIYAVKVAGNVFDPDWTSDGELVERVMEDLGLEEEEARRRLVKAGLIGDDVDED